MTPEQSAKFTYLESLPLSEALIIVRNITMSNNFALTEKLLKETIETTEDPEYKRLLLLEIFRLRDLQNLIRIAKHWLLQSDEELDAISHELNQECLDKSVRKNKGEII